jgi:hypothetical protein
MGVGRAEPLRRPQRPSRWDLTAACETHTGSGRRSSTTSSQVVEGPGGPPAPGSTAIARTRPLNTPTTSSSPSTTSSVLTATS